MKAVIKREPKPGIEVCEVDVPKIGPRDLLLEVKATAYCGSDLHLYKWDAQALKFKPPLPKILGHEFCGIVVEAGGEVRSVKVGDLVAGETHIPCETCYMCRTGRMHICENLKIYGVQVPEGSFAEYAAIPESIAYKLPEGTSFEDGSLYEPCGVAMHAVERAHPEPGDIAAVLGCGPIGLYAQQILDAMGVRVYATDINSFRINMAKKIGAAREVIDATEGDVVERIRALTPGERGPDIVIEAAGSVDTIRQSLEMVAKVGRVVLFGACGENPTLDTTSLIVYKEIDVMGMTGRYMYGTWNKVERMVSDGKINLRSVVTHRLPLAEADKGFQLLVKGDASKIVLSP